MTAIAPSISLPSRPEAADSALAEDSLLSSRIASALLSAGHSLDEERKVIDLVHANTIKIALPEHVATDSLNSSLFSALQSRPSQFQLNSNEPVLLLSILAQDARVKDQFIDYLRSKSIKPVRVYVELSDARTATLLNVVNTDIGGPSMVQLLDAAFHTEWKSDLVLKEAWDGFDLLWRDETWPLEDTSKSRAEPAIEGASVPAEPPVEQTVEQPVEQSVEQLVEQPAEQPAEQPVKPPNVPWNPQSAFLQSRLSALAKATRDTEHSLMRIGLDKSGQNKTQEAMTGSVERPDSVVGEARPLLQQMANDEGQGFQSPRTVYPRSKRGTRGTSDTVESRPVDLEIAGDEDDFEMVAHK